MENLTSESARRLKLLRERYPISGKEAKSIHKLLVRSHPGSVLYRDPATLTQALKNGCFWEPKKALLKMGRTSDCHGNSARLMEKFPGQYQMVSGYALNHEEGLDIWRDHSWLWETAKNRVVETTAVREAYYGYIVSEKEWLGLIS